VFCHGLLGFDFVTIGPSIAPVQVTHWRGIQEVLEANGIEILITRVPATSSVADRARVLEEKISAVYPGRSVHLIGARQFLRMEISNTHSVQVTVWYAIRTPILRNPAKQD
jgi:NADH/NAD ratio-sensing transcriptional regulator Rex